MADGWRDEDERDSWSSSGWEPTPTPTQPAYGSPLHRACETGNLEALRGLIARGDDINTPSGPGNATVAHKCAASNRVDMMKLVIAADGFRYAQNSNKETAYHIAARRGHYEILQLLIETDGPTQAQKELQNQDDCGMTPLINCAQSLDHRCIKLVWRFVMDNEQRPSVVLFLYFLFSSMVFHRQYHTPELKAFLAMKIVQMPPSTLLNMCNNGWWLDNEHEALTVLARFVHDQRVDGPSTDQFPVVKEDVLFYMSLLLSLDKTVGHGLFQLDPLLKTALCYGGCTDIIQMLLEHGARPDIEALIGMTMNLQLQEREMFQMAKLIEDHGHASVWTERNCTFFPMLTSAMIRAEHDVYACWSNLMWDYLLLEMKLDINAKDTGSDCTALTMFCGKDLEVDLSGCLRGARNSLRCHGALTNRELEKLKTSGEECSPACRQPRMPSPGWERKGDDQAQKTGNKNVELKPHSSRCSDDNELAMDSVTVACRCSANNGGTTSLSDNRQHDDSNSRGTAKSMEPPESIVVAHAALPMTCGPRKSPIEEKAVGVEAEVPPVSQESAKDKAVSQLVTAEDNECSRCQHKHGISPTSVPIAKELSIGESARFTPSSTPSPSPQQIQFFHDGQRIDVDGTWSPTFVKCDGWGCCRVISVSYQFCPWCSTCNLKFNPAAPRPPGAKGDMFRRCSSCPSMVPAHYNCCPFCSYSISMWPPQSPDIEWDDLPHVSSCTTPVKKDW